MKRIIKALEERMKVLEKSLSEKKEAESMFEYILNKSEYNDFEYQRADIQLGSIGDDIQIIKRRLTAYQTVLYDLNNPDLNQDLY